MAFVIELPWKDFSIDLPSLGTAVKQIDSTYCGNSADTSLKLWFNEEPAQATIDAVNALWSQIDVSHPIATAYAVNKQTVAVEAMVSKAMAFGNTLMTKFSAQNIQRGITQAGKTKVVRQAMQEVTNCLVTGSLIEAIEEIKAIPQSAYDSTFITPVRLLDACNQLEAFCGLPLSTSLE